MNPHKLACILVLTSCLLVGSCTNSQPVSSGSTNPAPAASESSAPEFDACTLFSVTDAQQIMSAPMKVASGSRAKKVCMYEEVNARPNSLGPGRISLTVNKRSSQEEENRGWASIKNVRHLEPGQKNVAALNGIGDEAWWTGNVEKGRIGVASIIARKGGSDFMVDSMVLEYVGSPVALKTIAKRIAGQLN